MTELSVVPLTAAARRGLEEAGITSLEDLASRTREEVSAVRGVGAAALAVIERELAAQGLAWQSRAASVDVPAEPLGVEESTEVEEPVEATEEESVEDAEAEPVDVPAEPVQVPAEPAAVEPMEPVAVAPIVPPAHATGFNPLAIVALALLLALPPASIVVGHIALSQLRERPQRGRELALIATILGYVFTGIVVLGVIVSFVVWLSIFGAIATSGVDALRELNQLPLPVTSLHR